MMAAGIAALFLGSLFAVNTSSMTTMKMARETASASQVLQQRVESMRIANWHQVTDADWIKANLLLNSAAGAGDLKSVSETLTLSPYGSDNSGGDTVITRNGTSVVINSRNTTLLTESAVKIKWTINYTGAPNDRPTTRQTVAILGKGGVAK